MKIAEDKVKNQIIEILGKEWPLTAKKIYFKIRRQGKIVTYQAVFKALQQLLEEKIIEKKKYDYLLSKEWLIKTTDFYDDLKKSYFSEHKNIVTKILKSPSITLTFDNYYKMLATLLTLITKLRFATKNENYMGYANLTQLMWPFAAGEKEARQLKELFEGYNKMYILCKNKNYTNLLIEKYYKNQNKNVFVIYDENCAQEGDIFVGGNILARIFYEKKFKESFDEEFIKLKDSEKVDGLNSIYKNLFLKKTKIKLKITRDKDLAEIKKQNILRKFERTKP